VTLVHAPTLQAKSEAGAAQQHGIKGSGCRETNKRLRL
jgi:hypothetical protein